MQVWFSNRRARLQKTVNTTGAGCFTGGLPSSSPGLGQYGAEAGFGTAAAAAHSGYQWPANPYLANYGYGGVAGQEKQGGYYNTGAGWVPGSGKNKVEGMGGMGVANMAGAMGPWAGAAALSQEYNS